MLVKAATYSVVGLRHWGTLKTPFSSKAVGSDIRREGQNVDLEA